MEAWRIVRKRFAADAFTGEGARLYGGRWNLPGASMVYTASSRSLAILEILVHLRRTQPMADYVLIPVHFDAALITPVEEFGLPAEWDREPPPAATQSLGNQWLASGERPVLSVPSVVVAEERNYLLNPAHLLFGQIRMGLPTPCRMDRRLLG
jgi:RES domain-containing protein